ncbi:MAG TPA: hypothetical protein VK639_19595 [Terriglobales bacterium]|nr:hypothetical protein [Terriglobales bacterium]
MIILAGKIWVHVAVEPNRQLTRQSVLSVSPFPGQGNQVHHAG